MLQFQTQFSRPLTAFASGDTNFSTSPFTHDLGNGRIVPLRYELPKSWRSEPFEFRTGWNRALFGMQTETDIEKDALHPPVLHEEDLAQIARHNRAIAERVVANRKPSDGVDYFAQFFSVFGRSMEEFERNVLINRSQPLGASYLAYLQNSLEHLNSPMIPLEELRFIYKDILESPEFAELVIPVLRSYIPDHYGRGVIVAMFDDIKDKLAYDAVNPHFSAYRGGGIL